MILLRCALKPSLGELVSHEHFHAALGVVFVGPATNWLAFDEGGNLAVVVVGDARVVHGIAPVLKIDQTAPATAARTAIKTMTTRSRAEAAATEVERVSSGCVVIVRPCESAASLDQYRKYFLDCLDQIRKFRYLWIMKRNERGTIYITRGHKTRPDLIRIGYTSKTIRLRLLSLTVLTGERFEVVGSVPGSIHDETYLHWVLRPSSYKTGKRTWYRRTPTLLDLVQKILSPGFKWSQLPPLRLEDGCYIEEEDVKGSDAMMGNICRDNLRLLVQAYGRATGTPVGQISKRFYGNVKFLREFLKGKQSMSIKKFDQVVQTFLKHWPLEADWPHLRVVVFPHPGRKPVPKKKPRPLP